MLVGEWHRINNAEMALLRAVYDYYDHIKAGCQCRPLAPAINAAYQECVRAYEAAAPAQEDESDG